MNAKATVTLRYYCVLPDDTLAADREFERQLDAITERLNRPAWPHDVEIVAESFTVVDADTEEDL